MKINETTYIDIVDIINISIASNIPNVESNDNKLNVIIGFKHYQGLFRLTQEELELLIIKKEGK